MNRIRTIAGLLCLLPILPILGVLAPGAMAQSKGWSEEKYLARESTLAMRVQAPAIAAEGDNVYAVYVQRSLKFIASRDRGKTWSQPMDLAKELNDCSSPALAVVGTKLVAAAAARVETNGVIAYQLFSLESADKGASWSKTQKIRTSRDDAFSPRFLVLGNQAKLLWMESPLSELLGKLGAREAINFNPQSVDALVDMRIPEGALKDKLRQTQSKFYVSTYNSQSGTYADPNSLDTIFSEWLPYVFGIYGPIDNSLYVVANVNTDINIYESKVEGAQWSKYYQDKENFNSKMMLDLQIIGGEWISTWIRRDPYQQIPINFRAGKNGKDIALSPPHYVRAVPRMAFHDGVYHIIWEAGNKEESWIAYLRTDKVTPTSKVVQPSSPDLIERSTIFQWEGNDNISATERLVYSFMYGDKPWSSIQSETSTNLKTPPDGEYIFKVRAEDVAGNIQEPPAQYAFNTFKSAPETVIVNAPPADQPLNSREAEVAFTGEDNSDDPKVLEYSAQTDGGPWTEFAKGDKHIFANLANGQHVLRLKMRDSRGNEDPTPAETSVTIKVKMEVVLQSTPPLFSKDQTDEFAWAAKDDQGNPIKLKYLYQLDKDETKELTEEKVVFSDLKEGRHQIAVWGKDASGDESAKVHYQWTVDCTPPETEASFSKEYTATKFPLISLKLTDPDLEDGTSPPTPVKCQYRINKGEWQPFDHEGAIWPASIALHFYSWGYIVQLRAVDAAGNIDDAPDAVDLRIFSRTNPYVFYTVVAILAIAVLLILKAILGRFFEKKPTRIPAPAAAFDAASDSDSFAKGSMDEPTTTTTTSKFSFDDDDDDLYK
ncbi:MAG: hypothetical protein AB1656_22045 [Candidatus Omnitrophota bacterium]